MNQPNYKFLPTEYQQFIALSRYARWLDKEGRRETWPETIERYCKFWSDRWAKMVSDGTMSQDTNNVLMARLAECVDPMLKLEVLPSMRALMTAGKALERNEVAAYNCAFCGIGHIRAFSEILMILLSGTGVGFSVEQKYISKLPEVPELYPTETTIVVGDSKIGWATSFHELISLLYAGKIPQWDVTKVRPAGSRLKTFGGRASGPDPLVDLFNFTVKTFKKAQGRKLKSIEVHDIATKIGEVVVVGGVRRAAECSLSDLTDNDMRHAKSGEWWNENPHRALANNSAVYNEKPSIGDFMDEWLSIYRSKSGERGIFNLNAGRKTSPERRNKAKIAGTQPCQPAYATVLTPNGISTIGDVKIGDTIWSSDGWVSITDKFYTGNKQVNKYKTSAGIFIGTENHKIVSNGVKVPVGVATEIDTLRGEYLKEDSIDPRDIMDGLMIGDGTYHKECKRLSLLIGENDTSYHDSEVASLIRSHSPGISKYAWDVTSTVTPEEITKTYNREVPDRFKFGGRKKICGFLRGLFSANGTVVVAGGIRCSLKATSRNLVEQVQAMLSSIGIRSYITIHKGKIIEFKNGPYLCRDSYALHIQTDAYKFFESIGFIQPYKQEKSSLVKSLGTRGNTKVTYEIYEVEPVGEEDVWDLTVDGPSHTYWTGGLLVSNCFELLLRDGQFCNLTTVIARPNDKVSDLERKVKIATFLGTIQSTLTNFKYIRKNWKENCEDERLIGVSIGGITDNPLLAGPAHSDGRPKLLTKLRDLVVSENVVMAEVLGIAQAAATTCVKPDGNSGQLCDSAPGIHPRYSEFHIRTVRIDKKDPLYRMMKDAGFPVEDEVNKPSSVAVFSFPMKAPDTATLRNDMTAIEQLELWLTYKRYWCEHNPSITVYVREDEWFKVGAWVYEHFDEVCGISFLPFSDHVYKQAPYQEITEEQYLEALSAMPKDVDWSTLSRYESDDYTAGAQELACIGGVCSI